MRRKKIRKVRLLSLFSLLLTTLLAWLCRFQSDSKKEKREPSKATFRSPSALLPAPSGTANSYSQFASRMRGRWRSPSSV